MDPPDQLSATENDSPLATWRALCFHPCRSNAERALRPGRVAAPTPGPGIPQEF
jgi:hypothetical protein